MSAIVCEETQAEIDRRRMQAALAFGRRWLGATAPNPAVGAILTREGVVVGRGATQPGGRPHAETEALRQAGELARGATLYVTLEPCSHHGHTPPCAQAVIAAGVSRVVFAIEDPDPRVAGRGRAALIEAGVSVSEGVCAEEARAAHIGHILRTRLGRPALTLKLAQTADGYAAGADHDQRLRITGTAANNRVQMMRALHDAIMVGAGTARVDDPLLTVRLPGMEERKPLRVVLDSMAALSLRSRLVSTATAWPTLVLCGPDAPARSMQGLIEAGVGVEQAAREEGGLLDLHAALHILGRRGLTRVFCEGGPKVASRLVLQGLADEVILFRGAMPLGRSGLPALSPAARSALADEQAFVCEERGRAGADVWERYVRTRSCSPA